MTKYYSSPRWSGEITDCSMPMTFDQYSLCSYRCLYCFAFFQKAVSGAKKDYLLGKVNPVNVESVKRIFIDPDSSEFGDYVKRRIAMQWGGMADPFDEHERRHGTGLELLRFFREIEYPISFSTKAVWWTEDPRYVELFKGAEHFNVKVTIITLNEEMVRQVEVGVEKPERRIQAIKNLARLGIGGVTLRLRPFIIGISTPTYLELIERAAEVGAEAVSTEFLCLENRAIRARRRFKAIGDIAGYDILQFYRDNSPGQHGYLRGNRAMKRPYIEAMRAQCHDLGLRFYVSDAHFKEYCANGSCCGLRESWNYSRGQFTEALLIAKETGRVCWSDIEPHLDYAEAFGFAEGEGFNQSTSENRAKFHHWTMRDWIRHQWNNVNGAKSPYKYFGGILYPVGQDENGDVVYEYRGEK